MIILSPSILAADFSKLGDDMEKAERAGAKWIHIDVMDGAFVPSISFGMPLISGIRKVSDMFFDTHLMINEPIRYAGAFKEAGADLLNIHVEACKNPGETIAEIKKKGMKAGITLNPETPVEAVFPYIKDVDLVLVMSVHPGFGGQSFIQESLDRISAIRNEINNANPTCRLEVDGGITISNVTSVIEAGADTIVAGTAVFKGDIETNVADFISKFEN